jgi:hypothetical protein
MRTFRIGSAVHALAIIAAVTAIPSHAQTVQAALSKEAGTLSDKFTGLARVMAGVRLVTYSIWLSRRTACSPELWQAPRAAGGPRRLPNPRNCKRL